jgi:hypothetical protein
VTAVRHPGAVLALFENGRRGSAALRDASDLAERTGAPLVVATLVWQQGRLRCCGGPSPNVIACAVRDEATVSLEQARRLLGAAGDGAGYEVIAGEPEPPLARWVAEHGVEVVFAPRRRLARRGHWAVRKLRSQAVDVRLSHR